MLLSASQYRARILVDGPWTRGVMPRFLPRRSAYSWLCWREASAARLLRGQDSKICFRREKFRQFPLKTPGNSIT